MGYVLKTHFFDMLFKKVMSEATHYALAHVLSQNNSDLANDISCLKTKYQHKYFDSYQKSVFFKT